MRQIIFRYWDSWNEVMTYSDKSESALKFLEQYQLLRKGENNPILEQYTGLVDETRSENYPEGIKIFEGDIVGSIKGDRFVISYPEESAKFQADLINTPYLPESFDIHQYWIQYHGIKVIGNIHENKELK